MSGNTGKIKINQGTYAIVHLQTKSIVIVGAQDGQSVAITPDAARALADELLNLATMAEGPENARAPMMTAFGPKSNVRM